MTLSGPCVTSPPTDVAGVQVLADHAVEVLLPHARAHAQPAGPGGDATTPDGEVVGDLQVDHADDPACGGGGRARRRPARRRRRRARGRRRPAAAATRTRAAARSGGADAEEPAGRPSRPTRSAGRRRPARRARSPTAASSSAAVGTSGHSPSRKPEADERRPRAAGGARRGDERDGVRGGRGPGDVEPAAGERPLGQVHVRVPEPGHEPAAVERHLRRRRHRARRSDGRDPPVAQQDVDGCRRRPPGARSAGAGQVGTVRM